MGQCVSSGANAEDSVAAAPPPPKDTALVLMPGGELREYPRPATAARVLEDADSSAAGGKGSGDAWFLCDADAVGLAEGPVPALGAQEPLRAGQIYFVLPGGARRRGLRREEVAALAVAASAALSARAAAAAAAPVTAGRRRRGAAVAPLVFAPPPEEEEEALAFAEAAAARKPPKRRPVARRGSGRRLERFASDLTAIPECETPTTPTSE